MRWRFSAGVIIPAVLLLVVTASAAIAFVVWSSRGIDERALTRQSGLVARAIRSNIAEIPYAQQSVAIWDDAIHFTRTAYDKDWLDNNLGIWMYDYYGLNAVAVFDDRDRPIYTMQEGTAPAPEFFQREAGTFSNLISELRADIAGGALERYGDGGPYPAVTDIKLLNGRPAVVSVMPITMQTGDISQAVGTEYLHLAVDYLDDAFAQHIEDGYKLDEAHFTQSASAHEDHASYPIFDTAGRLQTFFEWRASRPGLELLNQTIPVLGIAFAIASLLVAVLVNSLWRSSIQLERERREANHQAFHDALTGLPNRAQFVEQLSRDLSNRRLKNPVALLVLDLDRFKQVNDTLGHDAGDDLICAVGQRLKELMGPADVVARLGGDEFAIVHICHAGPKGPLALAETIIGAIAKPFDVAGSEAFVGTSIGIAIAGKDDRDPRELTRRADIALYEAKATGRNRFVIFEEAMNQQLLDRHKLEADLREAIKSGDQITVAYQPLYDGRTSDIAGVEALARWEHPVHGQVSPARFISVAEGAGLIEALGEIILRRACSFGERWPGRRVAANISPVQPRPRFAERLLDLLVETGMSPADLELEITESIIFDTAGPAHHSLTTLRKAGIRIALDDFGTGYSSLNYSSAIRSTA